ncbi:MAG: hypothetical protein QOG43_1893 [Actinomycetota bacterium]|jgi:hypothetical protein|nr:hypothetical protein [Actinomycetota bacterium]
MSYRSASTPRYRNRNWPPAYEIAAKGTEGAKNAIVGLKYPTVVVDFYWMSVDAPTVRTTTAPSAGTTRLYLINRAMLLIALQRDRRRIDLEGVRYVTLLNSWSRPAMT